MAVAEEEMIFERRPVPNGLEVLLEQKAADLFAICDQEDKGFVTKRDMQRMRDKLALDPDQLENVFDALDQDHNGYLTLEEFTQGFEAYLGVDAKDIPKSKETRQDSDDIVYEEEMSPVMDSRTALPEDSDEQFEALLDQLGVKHLVSGNDEALRAMWESLNADPHPEMMAAFEEVLAKLTGDLQKKSDEQETLESSIKNRNKTQEEHLQHLYEEMEHQIQKERQKIKEEAARQEQKTRKDLEAVLEIKDVQLNNLLERSKSLHEQLESVKSEVPEIREENMQLSKEKTKLEKELERQRLQMLELQDQLDSLKSQTQEERRQRASAAFKVSENIVMEREDLVRELDLLRSINTKLIDEKDTVRQKNMTLPVNPCYKSLDNHSAEGDSLLPKCMSLKPLSPEEEKVILMETSGEDLRRLRHMKPLNNNRGGVGGDQIPDLDGQIEYDEEYLMQQQQQHVPITESSSCPLINHRRRRHNAIRQTSGDNVSLMEELATSATSEDRQMDFPHFNQQHQLQDIDNMNHLNKDNKDSYTSNLVIYTTSPTTGEPTSRSSFMQPPHLRGIEETSLTSCTGPMSYDTSADFSSLNTKTDVSYNPPIFGTSGVVAKPEAITPERVFKVIFIGDTCVGKSSLISRFCRNKFNVSGSKSTIGVDFQTRSLKVEDSMICLQCWDTAGQERYRSITRQYFRKADAVVVVYDITNEKSYLNARHWLMSAKEAVGGRHVSGSNLEDDVDGTVFSLLGNKADLADDDVLRKVRKADGLKLSSEFQTLFGEVSAADGRNVEIKLWEMAKILQEKQDLDIQKAMTLSLEKKSKQNKKFLCC